MRKWTLREKKKMIAVLATGALAALFGYIETLIPPVFFGLAHLGLQLAVLPALFVLLAYGPLESLIVYGLRCITYGLVTNDGYAILFELAAYAVAVAAVYGVMKLRKVGGSTHGAVAGVVYALVYSALGCILTKSGAIWQMTLQSVAFCAVNMGVWGVAAYVALRYIPARIIFDDVK